MTTPAQYWANTANAAKSTGPRTERGKEISSNNARKHGLTAPPPWDDVTQYYRIITGETTALPDPLSNDPYLRAALVLAEAEAHCARCVAVERSDLIELMDLAKETQTVAGRTMAEGEADTAVALQVETDRLTELRRRLETVRRYRREAEARRRKAFRQWCEVMMVGGIGRSQVAEQGGPG